MRVFEVLDLQSARTGDALLNPCAKCLMDLWPACALKPAGIPFATRNPRSGYFVLYERLMSGFIIPYWSDLMTIHHYVFTDATGAEYRLDVNTAGVWTSSEGIYLSYDSAANRLYFPDGCFCMMAAISGGTEQDAGTQYPTIMEDTNGNQIFIRYNTGVGAIFANSSARISEVEDVRAVLNGGTGTYQSYTFTYTTDAIPQLTQIT